MSEYYCGMQDEPPKGKILGDSNICFDKRQVRRYGRIAVDIPKDRVKGQKKLDRMEEMYKLAMLQIDAKGLLKKFKDNRQMIEIEGLKNRKRKELDQEYAVLKRKRDRLIKKLEIQKEIVETLEKENKKKKK